MLGSGEVSNLNTTDATTSSLLIVHYINVGEADSILIEKNGKFMLIDGGNKADSKVVINYLKSKKVTKLEYVIATHPHEDHIGGLVEVIKTFLIGNVIMPKARTTTKIYEDLLKVIKAKGLKITASKTGTVYKLNNTSFTILAPNSTT